MVVLEHRPRAYNALTTVVEAMALLFVHVDAKDTHMTSPHGKGNGSSIPDDCERTATVALPTAASPDISIAALDAFLTVYYTAFTFDYNRASTVRNGLRTVIPARASTCLHWGTAGALSDLIIGVSTHVLRAQHVGAF